MTKLQQTRAWSKFKFGSSSKIDHTVAYNGKNISCSRVIPTGYSDYELVAKKSEEIVFPKSCEVEPKEDTYV